MKKLLLIALLFLLSFSVFNPNFFKRFKKGFYFEKYSTAQEAEKALLKLHPIGSDIRGFMNTVEKAGAIVRKYEMNRYCLDLDSCVKMKINNVYEYSYVGGFFFNPMFWGGRITSDKDIKIINFGLSRFYMGL